MDSRVRYGAAAMAMAMTMGALALPQGEAAHGQKVYLAAGCYQCHGRVGQGGLMTGPAPILAQTRLPFAAFSRQVRSPVSDMPPYPETLLSAQDLADIFAFLQALPGRRPVKEVPMLND